MITRATPPVIAAQLRIAAFFAGIAALSLVVTGLQCVAINGGAAELSWSLRTFEGGPVESCDKALVDKIRLCWNSIDSGVTGCRPGHFRDFACADHTGATLFEIEPGRTAFFAVPICSDGQPARLGTFQAPTEIVRTVSNGEVVSLESLLIVVTEHRDSCGPECTCVRE